MSEKGALEEKIENMPGMKQFRQAEMISSLTRGIIVGLVFGIYAGLKIGMYLVEQKKLRTVPQEEVVMIVIITILAIALFSVIGTVIYYWKMNTANNTYVKSDEKN